MQPNLSRRAEALRELMEDPDCDRAVLFQTYREFATTNRWLAGWRRLYTAVIRPRLRPGESFSVLDIGFGGGDIPCALARWAWRDGYAPQITGIEQDERALAYAVAQPAGVGVLFRRARLPDLAAQRATFDFVISNHVLHHLPSADLAAFRTQVEACTRRVALMNDIRRSRLGYALFAGFAPLVLRAAFSVPDGLTSIRRSFTRAELQDTLGRRWRVRLAAWFRLVAVFEP